MLGELVDEECRHGDGSSGRLRLGAPTRICPLTSVNASTTRTWRLSISSRLTLRPNSSPGRRPV